MGDSVCHQGLAGLVHNASTALSGQCSMHWPRKKEVYVTISRVLFFLGRTSRVSWNQALCLCWTCHYDAVGLILVPPPASKYRSIPKCAAYSATTYDRYIYPSYHSTDDQHHFFLLSVPELGLVGRRHQDRGLKPTSPSTLYASNRRHSLFCVVSRNQ